MKMLILAAITFLAIGAATVIAEEPAKPTPPAATAPSTQAAVPVNKKCPVTGDDVDLKGKTVVYKGKTIGFCCDDCVDPFKKNPEKYAKNIK